MMPWLRGFVDSRTPDSRASRFRKQRHRLFLQSLSRHGEPPFTILDVGGTTDYWIQMAGDSAALQVTVVNTEPMNSNSFVHAVQCDARNLRLLAKRDWDVVFSNSLIEHFPTFEDQRRVADEILSFGVPIFVQTPAFEFPIEPHFVVPGFHWLPMPLRARLLRTTSLGWFEREPDRERALEIVSSIRLLRKRDVVSLFPEARILTERWFGLPKSYIATTL